ncbi:M20 peptidase aminoacylase family protein [Bacillus sp. 1P06AnD]|uniref:M20 peptidase aminoacylase family protein n=1 Tax=Bacillus sp. 1P06AnD TaxID=3132208 RepID=UPI0039A1DAD5
MQKEEIKTEIEEVFTYLHDHPEISWKEVETTKYIEKKLREYGCSIRTFQDCTGVVGELGAGLPVIAVRSDIDALWQEVDGEFRANHSCGHDAHMAIVLGVMMRLANKERIKRGTIRFIFQPAEEKGEGALKMVKEGVLQDVDYLYGVHVRPQQETEDGRATPAILHGASAHFSGAIIGEEAHGARPHLGVNSIEVAAALVNRLSQIHMNPMVPHSIKMTSIRAGGESSNIIPAKAYFSLDVRTQTNEMMDLVENEIKKASRFIGESFGATIEIAKRHALPAAKLDEQATEIMAAAISHCLGGHQCDSPIVSPGGEDFHYYALSDPSIHATMLGLGCGLQPGLHHPKMTFNREAIFSAIDILETAVEKTMHACIAK